MVTTSWSLSLAFISSLQCVTNAHYWHQLTPSQLKSLEAAQLMSAEADQLKSLEAASMMYLETALMKSLEVAPMKSLEAAQLMSAEAAPMMSLETAPVLSIEEESEMFVQFGDEALMSEYSNFVTDQSTGDDFVEEAMAELFKEDDLKMLTPSSTPDDKMQDLPIISLSTPDFEMQMEEAAAAISTLPSVVSPLPRSQTEPIRSLTQLFHVTMYVDVSSDAGQTGSTEVEESVMEKTQYLL